MRALAGGTFASFASPAPDCSPLAARPRLATGNPRLDALLCGGLPAGSILLLYGPAFCGKSQLATQVVRSAAGKGIPCTVLHSQGIPSTADWPRQASSGSAAPGSITFLDCLRATEALPDASPGAPGDPGTIPCLVYVESVSTLILAQGAAATFQTLRTLSHRAVQKGGIVILGLEAGMHTEAEVEVVKHLCSGMVEFRRKGERRQFHVDGLVTTPPHPGWIEYESTESSFRVTGSFAAGRIR